MKFKRYHYDITVSGIPQGTSIDSDVIIVSGFILKAVSVNEEQAKKISEILYPDINIINVKIENKENNYDFSYCAFV